MKKKLYQSEITDFYFWRTYDGQEIDLIESNADSLKGIEIKWKDKKIKVPAAWQKNYPGATFSLVNPENYLTWIL